MSRYDEIVAALLARLATITAGNGYRTDAGRAIYVNLEYQTLPPEAPCLIVFFGDVADSLEGDSPPSVGEENHILPVTIEGVIDDDATGAAGQLLRQDILRALKIDRYFGGLTDGYTGPIESAATVFDAGNSGFRSTVQIRANIFYVTLIDGES